MAWHHTVHVAFKPSSEWLSPYTDAIRESMRACLRHYLAATSYHATQSSHGAHALAPVHAVIDMGSFGSRGPPAA